MRGTALWFATFEVWRNWQEPEGHSKAFPDRVTIEQKWIDLCKGNPALRTQVGYV